MLEVQVFIKQMLESAFNIRLTLSPRNNKIPLENDVKEQTDRHAVIQVNRQVVIQIGITKER